MTGLWYAPRKEMDEATGSWLIRAGSLYGVSASDMKEHLKNGIFVQFFDKDEESKEIASLSYVGSNLHPRFDICAIGAYCPICFARDFRLGRVPYFRFSWQRPWCTHCQEDETPLFQWPHQNILGEISFPPWVAKRHFDGGPVENLDIGCQKFLAHLRCARKIRTSMASGELSALSWRQQIEQEKILLNPTNFSTYVIAGINQRYLRRVVADIVTLLCNSFSESAKCQASYLAEYLGPAWLFSRSFASGRPPAGDSRRYLRSFSDPAQRRSLITLSLRLLSSFAADPGFHCDATLDSVGETSLSRSMDKLSDSAVTWARRRSKYWPFFVTYGIRSSLRCSQELWP